MFTFMSGSAALQVLAEPRRMAILELLRDGERPVGELVELLHVSQPAVSKHLRVLRDAGLVEARVDDRARAASLLVPLRGDRRWRTMGGRLRDHVYLPARGHRHDAQRPGARDRRAERAGLHLGGEEKLRFEFSPDDGGTNLIVIDELPPDAAARNAAGWDICLDHLAGRKPADDAWRSRFDAYAAAFEPVLGPQAGPPADYEGN
jgi:DNA-binding transcriptional ArsR family regulator